MSISGQIVSEIVAQLCLENSIQTLLNFFGSTPKKLEGFAGLSKIAGCRGKLAPTWLVSAGYSTWHFFMDGVF